MEYVTEDAEATAKLGQKIGSDLKKGKIKQRILAFYGNLGSGKTTFIQGLAKGLGIKKRLISPTFVLVRQYLFKKGWLYHVDLYRLKNEEESRGLGLTEMFEDKDSLVLIEWAEKIKQFLPKNRLEIHIKSLGDDRRKIIVAGEFKSKNDHPIN